MTARGAGAHFNRPDARDLSVDRLGLSSGSTRDVRLNRPPILNQGATNSCTGFALAGAGGTMERQVGLPWEPWSPWFPYWHGRQVDGLQHEDEGAYARSVQHAARHRGVPYLRHWDRGMLGWRVNRQPSRRAHRHAYARMGLSYWWLSAVDLDLKVEQANAALDAGLPLLISLSLRESLYRDNGPFYYDTFAASDPVRGGHRMYIAARRGGYYGVVNSWGPTWRDGGVVWFSPEVLALFCSDVCVLTGWERLRSFQSTPRHYLEAA